MFERIKSILIKEFIQIFRDPKTRAIIFVIPIIQTVVFGYAVTTDVKNIRTAVYDLDNSVKSRQVIDAFAHSGYFNIVGYVQNDNEMTQLLDKGKAVFILHFDHDFESKIKAGRPAPIQAIVDGTDSNTAGVVVNYIAQIAQNLSQEILIEKWGKKKLQPELYLESRSWFNPNLESRNFYVPGVVAILITLMTLTLTSMAIVREKETGTMEQIIVTPISKLEFILGKTVPFIIIGFIEVLLILNVAVYWFEVPIRGSILLLFFAISLYLLTTLGIGLFISTISQTQQQAMMSALLFYFPAVLLSGFIFPIINMPLIIQWLTFFNPLKYFLIIIRGIFLKGVGMSILWPQFMMLGIMGLAIILLSANRFHKTMA